MQFEFVAERDPSPSLIEAASDLTPENPFYTKDYVAARRLLGATPYLLSVSTDNSMTDACTAFLTRGRFNGRLEITSLPALTKPETFWSGLFKLCAREAIGVLSVHTFGSEGACITVSNERSAYKRRSEYRIELDGNDLLASMNRRSRRMIRKAEEAGLEMRRSRASVDRLEHIGLANHALERRRRRGDSIAYEIGQPDIDAYLDAGDGELIQAVLDGEIFASMLILRSPAGAYAQSSGSTDQARETGASHFLFYKAAQLLRSEGKRIFNIGGADETSSGLREFKLGFGAREVPLESAEFYTGGPVRRIISKTLGRLTRASQD